MRYEGEIQVERKSTTMDKLTIAYDGRIALKVRDSVDQAGEAWLLEFARFVIGDALENLPREKTLRGRFERGLKQGKPVVRIDLHSGSYRAREILKSYVSEGMGLPEPPASV